MGAPSFIVQRIAQMPPRQDPQQHALAKCSYCGRYGSLGQCQGCGATNQPTSTPALKRVPDFPLDRVVK